MDDRFAQQLKKGVLEMLVLEMICRRPTYGYELLTNLRDSSGGLFALKEGTLYPILYRLEDDGMITAAWSAPEGRTAPKKVYSVTDRGRQERMRRRGIWRDFVDTVYLFQEGEDENV